MIAEIASNVQEPYVWMTTNTVLGIAGAIVVALSGAIAILFRMFVSMTEKKNDAIIELTKSFIQTTVDLTKAVENNTKVIEKIEAKK